MKAILLIITFCLCHLVAFSQIRDYVFDDGHGKYGFKDKNGKFIIKGLEYASWDYSAKVGVYAKTDRNKRGVLNEYGKEIIPCIYSEIEIQENLIKVRTDDYKYGVYTTTGKLIVPCCFSFVWCNKEGVEVTNEDGLRGVYTSQGNIIFPCKYTKTYVSYDIICAFNNEKTECYIIKEKKYVNFNNIYTRLYYNNSDGYFYVYDNELQGLADKNGNEIIPCIYKDLHEYDLYVRAKNQNDKWGLLTVENNELVPFEYYNVNVYQWCGIIMVENNSGKKGAYDLSGKKGANCNYDTVINANEDLYIVKQNGKWGYCANGKEVIACQYDEAGTFANGVATVKKDGEVKLIKNPLKNTDEIQIAEGGGINNKKTLGGPAVSRYPAPNSDVDKDIPTNKSNPNSTTFAFIISNENYPEAPVPYALNDGRIFKEYCQKTLALPENHIFVYEDATFGNIIAAVEKMKDISKAYDNEAKLIIYYAGHGVPDEKNNSAYLLPIDGNANSVSTTGYSLAKFYSQISEMKPKSAVVFIDACFSGAKREDQMLTSARGVAIKVKNDVPQGNLVVFSAAQGDETAHQNESKGHGLFTYYLLKKLQETSGNVTLGELSEYVIKQVKRQSVVINNKLQVPMVIPSQSMINTWQNLGLK